MTWFYYLTNGNDAPIRIKASRRPAISTKPGRGTWVIEEFNEGKWFMPCFCEVTWSAVKAMTYIGSKEVKNV